MHDIFALTIQIESKKLSHRTLASEMFDDNLYAHHTFVDGSITGFFIHLFEKSWDSQMLELTGKEPNSG